MKELLDEVVCDDAANALTRLPDNSVDLTVTSPPYDSLRLYEGYSFDFEGIAKELSRVTKVGGVIVWVCGDATIDGSETGTSFRQALFFKDVCGLKLHDTMIYEKSAFANPSNNRYHQAFEYMFVFSKGKPKTFNPLKDRACNPISNYGMQRRQRDGSMSHPGDRSRIEVGSYGMRFNIWRYVTGKGNVTKDEVAYEHPALFPEKLAEDHIHTWSNEGEIVLDPMCGSGTTCKMAAKLGRHFIGIDVSPRYVEITKQRVKPYLKQERLAPYYDGGANERI